MKVYAVTRHATNSFEDDTDTLIGIFYERERAVRVMNEVFDDWVQGIDLSNGWEDVKRSDSSICLSREFEWSRDHIVVAVEEVEVHIGKKQEIADKLTSEILSYFFGDRFRECDNVEDDREMNHAWEYFNNAIYEELNQVIGD